jgi:peptidoglycan LD-endopeptidase LytH
MVRRRTGAAVEEASVRRLFPSLAGWRAAKIDLDAAYQRWRRTHPDRCVPGGPNPYLDPNIAGEIMDEIHRAESAAWSFGGYLEDRRHLLAGSYLDATGYFIHLGVDVHVPKGTPLAAGAPGTVLLVDDDQDQDGGWGPRVFLRRALAEDDDIVGIFAHLQAPRCRAGDEVGPAEVFAEIGGPPGNGNWHPHLHLQVLGIRTFEELLGDGLSRLDGYGPPGKKRELAARFADPLRAW